MVPVNPQAYLEPCLDRLRLAVLEQNRPGSVEGLLAQHVLCDDLLVKIEWHVGCTQEWVESKFKPTNLDHAAALGYFIWANPTSRFMPQLLDGLSRVRERDAFKGEHLSIARSPTRLLGIILGSLAAGGAGVETLTWCRDVLEKLEQDRDAAPDPLVRYLYYRAFNRKVDVAHQRKGTPYDLAVLDWMIRRGMCQIEPSLEQLRKDQHRILYEAATELHFESASQAAFILASIRSTLFHALGNALLNARHVAAVLGNFEPAMKRWRWDGRELLRPIRWPITQEREVQDLLWLILRSYFPDVVDEDALPKLGHSTYKADFGIASLKLILEAKFATSKDDFKRIEKEVQEDCVPYLRDLRYESLIVFIYDDSASVQEHDTTRAALLELPGVVDVIIVSRPSQLPAKCGTTPSQRPGAGKRRPRTRA